MIYATIGMPMIGRDWFCRYQQFKYIRCLRRAGAMVQIIPSVPSPHVIKAALEQCDGFLFPGGSDIQPQLYGRDFMPGSRVNPVRDDFELPLLHEVLKAGKPLLCIGRGMQLLNVAFGGTLIQDLKPRQEYQHNDFLHRASATHPIEIDMDSLLSEVLNSDTATVNSLHHQAVDDIGEGLWIAADSPDGFPEALEIEDYPFCLAVQWHPEYMVTRTPVQQKLFQALTDACRQDGRKDKE